jgi:tetratricopeptide (TPR) repeat protein
MMQLHGPLVAAAAVAGFVAVSVPTDAAVTVLGTGPAAKCYRMAQFGGDPAEGIAICNFALENYALPTHHRAATLVNRGILKSRIDNPHGALADYNAAIKFDDRLADAYVNRGAVMISLRRYQTAYDDITHGLQLGSSEPAVAYYDRAICNEDLGNIRAAYEDYRMALRIDPDFNLASTQLRRFKVIRKDSLGGA